VRSWVAVAVGALACSAGAPHELARDAAGAEAAAEVAVEAPPPRRICDGSDGIRFVFRAPVDLQLAPEYEAVVDELGFDFLYVDGHCHYWVMQINDAAAGPLVMPFAVREGDLDAEAEQSVHDWLSYDDVDAMPCDDLTGRTIWETGTPMEIWDGERLHTCANGWIRGYDYLLRYALYKRATEVVTPGVRIEVGKATLAPNLPELTWPLATPPASYAVPPAQSRTPGVSTLITDPADVDALRELRAQRRLVGGLGGLVQIAPDGYVVGIRDDLPFTSPIDGLWHPH
jgi:hypothetical protein